MEYAHHIVFFCGSLFGFLSGAVFIYCTVVATRPRKSKEETENENKEQ